MLARVSERLGLLGFACCGLGCGFEIAGTVTDAPIDTPPVDMMPDEVARIPASCKAHLASNPSAASGTYEIDPDGEGGDAPLTVVCDMTTDDGGWTIVFFPDVMNMNSTSLMYTVTSSRLLADATEVLIAYRTANQTTVVGDRATLVLPAQWRTASPLAQVGTDLMMNVRINGAAPVSRVLRFGYQSFTTHCFDPWVPADTWGRLCIVNSRAPFFNGFSTTSADYCSDSMSVYSGSTCNAERRFSLAVR